MYSCSENWALCPLVFFFQFLLEHHLMILKKKVFWHYQEYNVHFFFFKIKNFFYLLVYCTMDKFVHAMHFSYFIILRKKGNNVWIGDWVLGILHFLYSTVNFIDSRLSLNAPLQFFIINMKYLFLPFCERGGWGIILEFKALFIVPIKNDVILTCNWSIKMYTGQQLVI